MLILGAGVCAASFVTAPARGNRYFRVLFGSGCAVVAIPPLSVLAGRDAGELRFDTGVPGGPWIFGIDALSALFLLIIVIVGAAAAVYGVAYFQSRDEARVRFAHLFLAALIVALALVVTARAVLPFLIAWECMAIAAYLLVVFEHERASTRRAGIVYLVSTHTAILALFLLFAIWGSGAADLTFRSLAEWRPDAPATEAALLALAFLGFGLKAGLVPLHFWLPPAHAAAPSHVSALMSGVVIKTGIYGLLRVVALLGVPPAWWGWLLLGSGAISAVLGVLWALTQHDLKRLLAFHSIENIGIILLGLGAGVLGLAYQQPTIALLGFAGASFHTLNHALFKSLLFLGAGAVYRSTGTRDIEQLGGLARWMPHTANVFLIGSVAIVGLPPLNGFVSEWFVFRSLLSAGFAQGELRMAVLFAASLGLIGALALACFAKVIGIIYLGAPRHPMRADIRESPTGMLWPQYALAGACVLIGLLPLLALPSVLQAAAVVARAPIGAAPLDDSVRVLTGFALALAAGLVLMWLLRAAVIRRVPAVAAETWACGFTATTARMQYTASSFAAPLLAAYSPVAGIRTERTADALTTHPSDPVLDLMLTPAWRRLRILAARVRPIQRGRLSLYLLYILLTLAALLLYLLIGVWAP